MSSQHGVWNIFNLTMFLNFGEKTTLTLFYTENNRNYTAGHFLLLDGCLKIGTKKHRMGAGGCIRRQPVVYALFEEYPDPG